MEDHSLRLRHDQRDPSVWLPVRFHDVMIAGPDPDSGMSGHAGDPSGVVDAWVERDRRVESLGEAPTVAVEPLALIFQPGWGDGYGHRPGVIEGFTAEAADHGHRSIHSGARPAGRAAAGSTDQADRGRSGTVTSCRGSAAPR